MQKLLTLSEVAQQLNVDERTIHRIIAKGQLQGVKVGKVWRFKPEDIDDYIDSRTVKKKRLTHH